MIKYIQDHQLSIYVYCIIYTIKTMYNIDNASLFIAFQLSLLVYIFFNVSQRCSLYQPTFYYITYTTVRYSIYDIIRNTYSKVTRTKCYHTL